MLPLIDKQNKRPCVETSAPISIADISSLFVKVRFVANSYHTMNIGCDANTDNISVDQKPIENVKQFQYLGSIITNDGDAEIDFRKRIGKATTVFRKWTKFGNQTKYH